MRRNPFQVLMNSSSETGHRLEQAGPLRSPASCDRPRPQRCCRHSRPVPKHAHACRCRHIRGRVLAMKVAVSPWARAQPMTSRFSMMTSSAARSGSLRCLRLTSNCPGAASFDDGVDRQVLLVGGVADHVEQRGMFGEIVESVHAQAVGTVHGGRPPRRRHAVVPVGTGLEQNRNSSSKATTGYSPPLSFTSATLLLQHLARVGGGTDRPPA